MLIDIEKVVVKDRIRKDFGDIKELAEDIQQNGLINPPVVNKNYELLAGERRLRACKSLGWTQIEVRMMDTRDAEHELNVEISENENRKEFSKSERADYMKRLIRIEQAKAQKRMKNPMQNSAEGAVRDLVSKQFGISHDTMQKEITITDNRELLDPKDFADWDEGKLSTNKVFQEIKRKAMEADRKIKIYETRISSLENRKPQTVEVEVVPEDYRSAKAKAKAYDAETERLNNKIAEANKRRLELEKEIADLKSQTAREKADNDTVASAIFFAAQCANFIRDVGGYVWLSEKLNELPDRERKGYVDSVKAVSDWASVVLQNIERNN